MDSFNETYETLVEELKAQFAEALQDVAEGVEAMWMDAFEATQDQEEGKVRVKIPVTVEFCLEQNPVCAIVKAKAKKVWEGESLPEGHKQAKRAPMSNAERMRKYRERMRS